MSVQWLRNGVALPGATGAQLLLGELARGNAGAYSAVISNGAGSITSNTAVVRVLLAQVLRAPERQGAQSLRVYFSDGEAGAVAPATDRLFDVWAAEDLTGATWVRLPDPIGWTNGAYYFDDRGAGQYSRRFYRVTER